MVRYGQTALVGMTHNDVAAGLMVHHLPQLAEGLDGISSGTDWQVAHYPTSTISSVMGRGIGSPCFLRLST